MQAPNWTDFLQCSICTSKFDETTILPISLSCGHALCMRCLGKLKTRICPYDKVPVRPDMEEFPPNAALLHLLGYKFKSTSENSQVAKLSESDITHYDRAVSAIVELATFLQPLAEHGITAAITYLNKPMLKKLVAVVTCQILESEGQIRAVRAARSIADRAVTELLVMHQNQQQISTLLWTAVRNRGCQFLGPVMQEEALRLILTVLESGNSLSRKNIVLFVVQRLSNDFPQASKTSVGHVVQLLYRASCFNVEKRDDDSSLMQLKEEFRSYECLRREHDGQIIRMAMEAGLRISPEQWSTLLYGDHKHKSDMQSIIDKLISQGAASTGLSELIVAIGRSQDPYQLSEKVIPHLEVIFKVPISAEKSFEKLEWERFAAIMEALLATLRGFTTFMQIQNGRFKTGMCPHLSKPGGCPKGDRCTYAHSEEERDKFRNMVKPAKPAKPRSGDQFRATTGRSNRSGDHGPVKAHTDTHVTLGSYQPGPASDQYSTMRYSGELRGHQGHHVTAPVLSNRGEWHRGVAAMDHTYHPGGENGLTSYVSADQVYPSPMGAATDPVTPYSVNQTTLSNIDLLRRRHEAVKQSVEGTLYTRDLPPPPPTAAGYMVAPAAPPPSGTSYVDPSQYSQQADWLPHDSRHLSLVSQKTTDSYSMRSDILSSGSLKQDSLQDEQFLSGELGGPSGVYATTSSYQPTQGDSSSSSSGDTSSSSSSSTSSVNITVNTTSVITTATTQPSKPEAVTATPTSTAVAPAADSSEDSQDLKAEIERLKEQLRKKDETIQQQNVQLHYSAGVGGVSNMPRSVVQHSTPVVPANIHYSTPPHQSPYGNGGVVMAEDSHHATPRGLPPQATPSYGALPQATPSYTGTMQYSSKQLQAAAAIAATIVQNSQPTGVAGGYYHPPQPTPLPPPAPTHTPQHQWSGPQPSLPQYHQPALVQIQPTPAREPTAFLEDEMLATYVQMLEQSKAPRATAPPTYQATPTYTPQPQGHYYYHHH